MTTTVEKTTTALMPETIIPISELSTLQKKQKKQLVNAKTKQQNQHYQGWYNTLQFYYLLK